jgi:hypothetical protein
MGRNYKIVKESQTQRDRGLDLGDFLKTGALVLIRPGQMT